MEDVNIILPRGSFLDFIISKYMKKIIVHVV